MKTPHQTPEREAFRASLRALIAAEVTPYADDWDEAGAVPWDLHAKFGELGVWGFGIDEAHGGLGFDDAFLRAIYAEELGLTGVGGVSAALNGRTISIEPIARLAAADIRDRVLPEILSGRKGSSLAVTEPGGGSDVAALRTKARRDGNHFVLNGEKTFITGGMTSDYFVVGARTGGSGLGGISLFFVEAGTPGFSRVPLNRKMGWWASDQATLHLDDVRVPADHLMGEEDRGFLAIMQNFNHERLTLIAGMLGMMRAVLVDAVAWAQERQTFGKRLIDHQVIRHKIADISMRIDATAALVDAICWSINDGDVPVAEISKAKVFASKALEFCASEGMQILGGAGYIRGNRIERVYREVKVMAIGGGSEEIMRDLAVRQMGL